MEREYCFDTANASIAVVRDGRQSAFTERCQSFLYDEDISAFVLKLNVYSYGDNTESHSVKMRAAIFEDEDCRELADAHYRMSEWECSRGNVSPNVKVGPDEYKKILELYKEGFRNSSEEICRRAVCLMDFEYSMPAGKNGDSLTLTLPVSPELVRTGSFYRIGVFDQSAGPVGSHDWAWFILFHIEKPLEDTFIPQAASLRVIVPSSGRYRFDNNLRFRSYNGFFDDIHYDRICGEVEVNPVYICFDLEYPGFSEKYFPFFTIIIESGDAVIDRRAAKIMPDGWPHMTVYCLLLGDVLRDIKDGEALAGLEVFGRRIATFPFSTLRTEKGDYIF